MGIKYIMILVTAAVILICCLNLFFFSKLNSSLIFFTEVKELVLLPSLVLVVFLSFFQMENEKQKGSRGIGNKEE